MKPRGVYQHIEEILKIWEDRQETSSSIDLQRNPLDMFLPPSYERSLIEKAKLKTRIENVVRSLHKGSTGDGSDCFFSPEDENGELDQMIRNLLAAGRGPDEILDRGLQCYESMLAEDPRYVESMKARMESGKEVDGSKIRIINSRETCSRSIAGR